MPRWLPIVGLIAFCGVLFFPALGKRDLTSSHEARAAQNAQTILDQGHWLVPQLFDRHLELQKPPLFYWCVAIIGWLKGGSVDAWAVRLPSALAALACVLFLYFLGLRTQRPRAGLFAALILASCLHFTWLARVGRIDMPLTAAITFALGAFHLGNLDGAAKIRWHAFGYAAFGVGLLLKGPIAVVLPATVAGTAWLLRDRQRQCQAWTTLWWGLPLTLAIAAPWYVWANLRTDNQLWEVFFWHHNVERGVGGSDALAVHPWWFYGPRMLVDLLPWSVFIPVAIYGFLRSEEIRKDKDVCLGLVWFVGMTLFLSCMSFKRADYLLPAYPGLAIFLGAWMERWLPEPDALARGDAHSLASASGSGRRLRGAFIGILVVYAGGWLIYVAGFAPPTDDTGSQALAAEIRRQTRGPVIFFRAESHLLTYHLGQPVATILEWENLEAWATKPGPIFFVMPKNCADEWHAHLPDGALEEVLHTSVFGSGKHAEPLVVLRNRRSLTASQ